MLKITELLIYYAKKKMLKMSSLLLMWLFLAAQEIQECMEEQDG